MDFILNTKIAKYVFGAIYLVFGILHFMNAEAMSGVVPSFLPAPEVFVYLTGLALIAAAVSIFIGVKTRLAMSLLTLYLIILVLFVHIPATMENPMSMSQVLKDLGLACGAIFLGSMSED